MNDIIIVGAGGFGRELLEIIKEILQHENKWRIKGFIDDNLNALDNYECDYSVIGRISDWKPAANEVFTCSIAHPQTKERVVAFLKERGAVFTQVIHPKVRLGSFNRIGEGVIIAHGAGLTVNINIGDFVTLLASGVGHDVTIGDYTTITSNCGINGNVNIGKRVFISSNAVVIPSKSIGDDAFIGAGSVVVTNVKAKTSVFGNPAKRLRL